MISNKGFIKESLLFGKIERSQEKFLNFRKRQMSLKEEEEEEKKIGIDETSHTHRNSKSKKGNRVVCDELRRKVHKTSQDIDIIMTQVQYKKIQREYFKAP